MKVRDPNQLKYNRKYEILLNSFNTLKLILNPNINEMRKQFLDKILDIINSQIKVYINLLLSNHTKNIYDILNINNQNHSKDITSFYDYFFNSSKEIKNTAFTNNNNIEQNQKYKIENELLINKNDINEKKLMEMELMEEPKPQIYSQLNLNFHNINANKDENKSNVKTKDEIKVKKSNHKNNNISQRRNNRKNQVIVPSIPYKDNGFEIGENNSLIKLECENDLCKRNMGKVGPGSYDLDNPHSWVKGGSIWSKSKVEREMNISNSKEITRPQTALELNINVVPVKNSEINKGKKRLKTANHKPVYKLMNEYSEDGKNLKVLKTNYKQSPGPGYYIDMQKNSEFYQDSQAVPESKQFFLSNSGRFPDSKQNAFLGPTTYFKNNDHYKSSFSSFKIKKNTDKNKIKKTPFSSREKRFKNANNKIISNYKTPGPGTYDPKLIKSIEENKFSNTNNTFNLRTKRFETNGTDLKWKISTPGPGAYINPYSATGTSNTLLINGLYTNIQKGKDILRPKTNKSRSLNRNGNNIPGVGSYNPGLISSISYNNRKKAKLNNRKNIAFNSRVSYEENKEDYRSNLGPGIYYKDKPVKIMQINPPFYDGVVKFKNNEKMFGIGPGYYEPRSYFDWNKKSYNVTFY